LIKREFTEKISEFEEALQKVASDIASGVLFEKLPPSELLSKTDDYINRLKDLTISIKELMLILKPEKAYMIKSMYQKLHPNLNNLQGSFASKYARPTCKLPLGFRTVEKSPHRRFRSSSFAARGQG